MLLSGYTSTTSIKEIRKSKKYPKPKNKIQSVDNRFIYSPTYEPIRGSDIFGDLPPKKVLFEPDYLNERKYEVYCEKKHIEESLKPQKMKYINKSYSSLQINCNNKNRNRNSEIIPKNTVYNINNLRYGYNPYKTTYNASYVPLKISSDTLVGNNKYLGTGVAYNSRKQKIECLKSNIFCDRDKYNQNTYLKDNFDPRNINHNNWYTNLDWRNNKSELIFYKDNQKEFYDNNSKNNNKYFELYK